MLVKNRRTTNLCFEEYLKLPGWSHSGIRNDGVENFEPTAKMQLGTHVHQYLLSPEEYEHSDISIIRPLAVEIKKIIGGAWEYLKPEISMTANFEHEGFIMPWKGRADLGIENAIVVDLKISELKTEAAMRHFNYERPISGYCAGLNAHTALMLSIHPKTKQTSLKRIPIDYTWWEEQITKYGEPIK